MRTLRRADLVHLDCFPDNIIYDYETQKVAVVDLDGCGIIDRSDTGRGENWVYPPLTIGKIELIRLPPWYPQIYAQCEPRMGNYLFGERWMVLDTVIRVLSWNRFQALSWLENSVRKTLSNVYKTIKGELAEKMQNNDQDMVAWWSAKWRDCINELSTKFARQLSVDQTTQYRLSQEDPPCLNYFMDLAQKAFLNIEALSNPDKDKGKSFYAFYLALLDYDPFAISYVQNMAVS
jgi:hypothetical protein